LKPEGAGNEGVYHEKTHGRVFGPSGRVRRTKDFRINQTHEGIFIRSKMRPSPPGQAASGVQELFLVAVFGNYTVCKNAQGGMFAVAKPAALRNYITSETIIANAAQTAVTYNYTYPHNPVAGGPGTDPFSYQMRVSTSATDGTIEKELIDPPYLLAGNVAPAYRGSTACVILAAGCSGFGFTLDPLDPYQAPLTMVEVGPRAWIFAQEQAI